MATIIQPNDIVVAVDPGFDATKVVVNGLMFKIPNNVIDVTGKTKDYLTLNNNKKASGYLLSRYIPEKEYLVGELARKSMLESDIRENQAEKHGMLDSVGRFQTTDFEVNLMTSIAYALVLYAKESVKRHLKPEVDLSRKDALINFRIIVGVALPNDWVAVAWPDIQKFLVGKHSFSIETVEGTQNVTFTIEKGHAMTLSQAVCALLGTVSTDSGNTIENSEVLEHLPCIVVDGGYKTLGLFLLTSAHKVAHAESNTDFAMGNVHKNVAKILREDFGRKDIQEFQIPALIEDGGIINYLETGANGKKIAKQVNILDIVSTEEEKLCKELIEYINEQFEDLLNVKEMVITGGTGAAYHRYIEKFIKEERSYLDGHVILTSYPFMGETIEPVYAIAVGMYKVLRNQLNRSVKKDNSANQTQTKSDGN